MHLGCCKARKFNGANDGRVPYVQSKADELGLMGSRFSMSSGTALLGENAAFCGVGRRGQDISDFEGQSSITLAWHLSIQLGITATPALQLARQNQATNQKTRSSPSIATAGPRQASRPMAGPNASEEAVLRRSVKSWRCGAG